MRESLKERLQPLRQQWDQLGTRDQRMLMAGALVVVITAFYLAIWEPMIQARAEAERALSDARATAQAIERAAVIVPRDIRRTSAAVDNDRSLLAIVDQAARTNILGKPPTRIQPDGDTSVRVWLDDVQLGNLLRWIDDVQNQRGLDVRSAEIERGGPGEATARLQIGRQS